MDLQVSPHDDGIAYITLSGFGTSHLYRTEDVGQSWTDIGAGLPDVPTSAVIIDPEDPDIAYCTYSNYGTPHHVLRTTNGGTDWESIDGIEATGVPDIPVHCIAVRPCDPQQLYVGTELGVFASDVGSNVGTR